MLPVNKDSYKHMPTVLIINIPLNGGNINCHDQCVQADGGIMYNSYLYTCTGIATCSYNYEGSSYRTIGEQLEAVV